MSDCTPEVWAVAACAAAFAMNPRLASRSWSGLKMTRICWATCMHELWGKRPRKVHNNTTRKLKGVGRHVIALVRAKQHELNKTTPKEVTLHTSWHEFHLWRPVTDCKGDMVYRNSLFIPWTSRQLECSIHHLPLYKLCTIYTYRRIHYWWKSYGATTSRALYEY